MFNDEHPDFDLARELICLLPCFPRWAYADQVINDLCLDNSSQLTPLRRTARALGVVIVGANRDTRRMLTISHDSWPKAKAVGDRYWKHVYVAAGAD